MNVAVLGATGRTGRPLVDELLRRGHSVTAVARDPKLGEAHFRLGQIQFDNRKLGAAIRSLRLALTNATVSDTWRPEANYMLGAAAHENRQSKLAIAALVEYLKIAPPGAALKRDARRRLRKLGWRPRRTDD